MSSKHEHSFSLTIHVMLCTAIFLFKLPGNCHRPRRAKVNPLASSCAHHNNRCTTREAAGAVFKKYYHDFPDFFLFLFQSGRALKFSHRHCCDFYHVVSQSDQMIRDFVPSHTQRAKRVWRARVYSRIDGRGIPVQHRSS